MDGRLLGWFNLAALFAVLAVMFLVDLGAGLLLLLIAIGLVSALDRALPRGAIAARLRRLREGHTRHRPAGPHR